jgi:hypothetical protein
LSKEIYKDEMKEINKYAYLDKRIKENIIPVLLINGSMESKSIVRSNIVLSNQLGNSEIKVLLGARHRYPRDNTKEVFEVIDNFLCRKVLGNV